jgi:hypothetical protein
MAHRATDEQLAEDLANVRNEVERWSEGHTIEALDRIAAALSAPDVTDEQLATIEAAVTDGYVACESSGALMRRITAALSTRGPK